MSVQGTELGTLKIFHLILRIILEIGDVTLENLNLGRNKDQSHTDKRGGAQILPWEMITMMMTMTIMVMIQQE